MKPLPWEKNTLDKGSWPKLVITRDEETGDHYYLVNNKDELFDFCLYCVDSNMSGFYREPDEYATFETYLMEVFGVAIGVAKSLANVKILRGPLVELKDEFESNKDLVNYYRDAERAVDNRDGVLAYKVLTCYNEFYNNNSDGFGDGSGLSDDHGFLLKEFDSIQ